MGQRSQIYVRYPIKEKKNGETVEISKGLIANYYQWNYGERMISRARAGINMLLSVLKYSDWYFKVYKEKIRRYFDVNFDMRDIVMSDDILKEWSEDTWDCGFADFVFFGQDNNDGKLLLDVTDDGIKYAFLDDRCSLEHIMNAREYMDWQQHYDYEHKWDEKPTEYFDADTVQTCLDNITEIMNNATLMTREEVEDFIHYDYEESKLKF